MEDQLKKHNIFKVIKREGRRAPPAQQGTAARPSVQTNNPPLEKPAAPRRRGNGREAVPINCSDFKQFAAESGGKAPKLSFLLDF